MSIEIRQATVQDAEAALAFYTDLLAEKIPYVLDNPVPTLEQEREFLQAHTGDQGALFLACDGERVVGLCAFRLAAHPQSAHCCLLGISVARSWRGRGLGTRLITAGLQWCRARSVRRLELEMIDGNPARRLYERLAFVVEGRKRQAVRVGDADMDIIIMARLLA